MFIECLYLEGALAVPPVMQNLLSVLESCDAHQNVSWLGENPAEVTQVPQVKATFSTPPAQEVSPEGLCSQVPGRQGVVGEQGCPRGSPAAGEKSQPYRDSVRATGGRDEEWIVGHCECANKCQVSMQKKQQRCTRTRLKAGKRLLSPCLRPLAWASGLALDLRCSGSSLPTMCS